MTYTEYFSSDCMVKVAKLNLLKLFAKPGSGTWDAGKGLVFLGGLTGAARAAERGDNPLVGGAIGAGVGFYGGRALSNLPQTKKFFTRGALSGDELSSLKKSDFLKEKGKELGFNPSTATSGISGATVTKDPSIKPRSIFSKDYIRSAFHDLTHPLKSTARTFDTVTHDITDSGKGVFNISKAAPAEQAYNAYLYWGLPASFAYKSLTDTEAPIANRLGSAATNLYSAATPKAIASMGVWQAGDKLFPSSEAIRDKGLRDLPYPGPGVPQIGQSPFYYNR